MGCDRAEMRCSGCVAQLLPAIRSTFAKRAVHLPETPALAILPELPSLVQDGSFSQRSLQPSFISYGVTGGFGRRSAAVSSRRRYGQTFDATEMARLMAPARSDGQRSEN